MATAPASSSWRAWGSATRVPVGTWHHRREPWGSAGHGRRRWAPTGTGLQPSPLPQPWPRCPIAVSTQVLALHPCSPRAARCQGAAGVLAAATSHPGALGAVGTGRDHEDGGTWRKRGASTGAGAGWPATCTSLSRGYSSWKKTCSRAEGWSPTCPGAVFTLPGASRPFPVRPAAHGSESPQSPRR